MIQEPQNIEFWFCNFEFDVKSEHGGPDDGDLGTAVVLKVVVLGANLRVDAEEGVAEASEKEKDHTYHWQAHDAGD